MAELNYDTGAVVVSDDVVRSTAEAWSMIAKPGTWWTGPERVAIAARARRLFGERVTPPWLRQIPGEQPGLTDETVAIVDKITLDAAAVDRAWATSAVSDIGDGPYVELVAVVATTVMMDMLAEAVGADKTPIPQPENGEPSRQRPDGLGDIGAHVPMLDPFPAANVARALSLVPDANKLFRTVSVPTYSAQGFSSLQWDSPLSRPQVELVASRVAAMNECFY